VIFEIKIWLFHGFFYRRWSFRWGLPWSCGFGFDFFLLRFFGFTADSCLLWFGESPLGRCFLSGWSWLGNWSFLLPPFPHRCLTNLPFRRSLRLLSLNILHFFLRAIFQILSLLINTHLSTSILGTDLLSPQELILELFQLFHFPFIGAILTFFVKAIWWAVLAFYVIFIVFFFFCFLTLLFLFDSVDGFWLTLNDLLLVIVIAIVIFNCSAVMVGALLGSWGHDDWVECRRVLSLCGSWCWIFYFLNFLRLGFKFSFVDFQSVKIIVVVIFKESQQIILNLFLVCRTSGRVSNFWLRLRRSQPSSSLWSRICLVLWWLPERRLRDITPDFRALVGIWACIILVTGIFIPRVCLGDSLEPCFIVHSGVILVLIIGVWPRPRASAVVSSAAAKVPRLISISIIISMATVVVVSVIAAVIIWVAVLVIVLLGAHSTTFANFNIILSKLNRLIKNTINTVE
jgi:hypothetical protein